MKKKTFIVISVLSCLALLFLVTCNEYSQNENESSNIFNILDSSMNSRLTITCTIDVNGSTWDGGGQTIICESSYFNNAYEESGYWHPAFNVTNGTVKNVTINTSTSSFNLLKCIVLSGGNCTIDNVNCLATDNALVKATKPGTYTVSNSTVTNRIAFDYLFHITDICSITYQNIKTDNQLSNFARQNGGKTWKCTIYIDGINITNATQSIARSDSSMTTVHWRNITTALPQSSWWYGNFVVKQY